MRRRIIAQGDHGLDVLLLQYMLNRILPVQVQLPEVFPSIKTLRKRAAPEDWGYYWAPAAWQKHLQALRHPKPPHHAHAHVVPTMPGRWLLHLDGMFGAKTEAAVMEYQRRVGIPADGIVGPETWEHLCPFWNAIIWFRPADPVGTAGAGASAATAGMGSSSARPFVGSPYKSGGTTLDNVEFQSGSSWNFGTRFNKADLSSFSVVQFTWKTEKEPDEILPGHWEHTAGFQKNIPYGKAAGTNLQIFYQLTRAELVSFGEDYKLTLVAPFVQGTLQAPLDAGTPADANLNQIGITLGNTLSLEITPGHGPVTLKAFAQGTLGVSVDSQGKVDGGFGGLVGASAQINIDLVDRILNPKGATPPAKKGTLNADPRMVTVKRGSESTVVVSLDRPEGRTEYVDVDVSVSPMRKLSISRRTIPPYSRTAELVIGADPEAPTGTFPLQISGYYRGTGITVWCEYEVQVTVTD